MFSSALHLLLARSFGSPDCNLRTEICPHHQAQATCKTASSTTKGIQDPQFHNHLHLHAAIHLQVLDALQSIDQMDSTRELMGGFVLSFLLLLVFVVVWTAW